MTSGLQLTLRGIESSPALEERVRELVEDLSAAHPRITGCRVVIDAPHQHKHKGKVWHVRIDVHVPGHEIVVDREPEQDHAHEDVYVALRDAFAAAKRRLKADREKRISPTA